MNSHSTASSTSQTHSSPFVADVRSAIIVFVFISVFFFVCFFALSNFSIHSCSVVAFIRTHFIYKTYSFVRSVVLLDVRNSFIDLSTFTLVSVKLLCCYVQFMKLHNTKSFTYTQYFIGFSFDRSDLLLLVYCL